MLFRMNLNYMKRALFKCLWINLAFIISPVHEKKEYISKDF